MACFSLFQARTNKPFIINGIAHAFCDEYIHVEDFVDFCIDGKVVRNVVGHDYSEPRGQVVPAVAAAQASVLSAAPPQTEAAPPQQGQQQLATSQHDRFRTPQKRPLSPAASERSPRSESSRSTVMSPRECDDEVTGFCFTKIGSSLYLINTHTNDNVELAPNPHHDYSLKAIGGKVLLASPHMSLLKFVPRLWWPPYQP